jgi:hypothetical protein
MVRLTKSQRTALARVYHRGPLGMDGAVVVRWQGMWLAIEADGYCHT